MINLKEYLESCKATLDYSILMEAIQKAVCEISSIVRKGSLENIYGSMNNINVQGEEQMKLDFISNQIFIEQLTTSGVVKSMASEEEEKVISGNEDGSYIVAFDPLDGSSNIDINGQIGTIFTVFFARKELPSSSNQQFYRSARDQILAGYVLYGPATQLVLAFEHQVNIFTLDDKNHEFILTNSDVTMPTEAKSFSINMSNYAYWGEKVSTYINGLLIEKQDKRKSKLNMRWNGAMVGDVHRVLLKGGIFLYPTLIVNNEKRNKLRLLYEALPIAYIIESSGGKAVADFDPILDLEVSSLHQRSQVIVGSKAEVDFFLAV